MKKKLMRLLTIVTLVTGTFSLTALALSFVSQSGAPQTGNIPTKRKTLREIAQERNIEYTVYSENEVEWGDPLSITKHADAVILGRITKAETAFTKSGEHIVTTYQLDVSRILRDKTAEATALLTSGQQLPSPLTTPLTLVREGGVVSVNGRRASAKVPGFDLLTPGKTYIFFLGWSPDLKAYSLIGGISGVVSVDDNLHIKPLASDEKVKLRYAGTDLETFVRKISLEH